MSFENTDQFVECFDFGEDYFDPVYLQDAKVGFSVKRKYPEGIRYKSPKTREGNPTTVAVIWVIYSQPREQEETVDLNKVPITLRIAKFDSYISRHWDYDFDDDEAPTKESVEESKESPQPVDLDAKDDYFYNHSRRVFLDQSGKEMSGKEVLDRIFRQHCDTVHLFRGLPLRAKIASRDRVHSFLGLPIFGIKFVLKKFFGRTISNEDELSEYFRSYDNSSLKKLSTDSFEIFGYKAPKGIILLFCILCIIAYLADFSYFDEVIKNETLVIVHAIFIIWALDAIFPPILFYLMNMLIWLRTKVRIMKFKVG